MHALGPDDLANPIKIIATLLTNFRTVYENPIHYRVNNIYFPSDHIGPLKYIDY
jgi:hypothetical protein